jgi:hypothetical protein
MIDSVRCLSMFIMLLAHYFDLRMAEKKSDGFFKGFGRRSSSKINLGGQSGNAQVSIPEVTQEPDDSGYYTMVPQRKVGQEMPVLEAGPSRAARRGTFAYAKKRVPMPIREPFQMPDHIPERSETPTKDDKKESVQIVEHRLKTPPHVLLSDDESLSFTVGLAAAIKADLREESVHDYPQEKDPRKEVMKNVLALKASRNKKGAKHEQRHAKEIATESPDESVWMYLDMDDVPR